MNLKKAASENYDKELHKKALLIKSNGVPIILLGQKYAKVSQGSC